MIQRSSTLLLWEVATGGSIGIFLGGLDRPPWTFTTLNSAMAWMNLTNGSSTTSSGGLNQCIDPKHGGTSTFPFLGDGSHCS